MIRKILFTMLLAVGAFLTAAGQESKTITLDMASGKTSELQKFSCCEVTATLKGSYDNAQVEIKLGNPTTDYNRYNRVVLFNEAYNKKELKAKKYKLDKLLGDKVEKCNNLNGIVYIEPNYDETLFTIRNLKSDTTLKFRLPVYTAVEKNTFLGLFGKKRVLLQCDVVEVSVKVQLVDPIDIELERRYNELVSETSGRTFCPNSQHKTGDNTKKKNEYETKKARLVEDIEDKLEKDMGKGKLNNGLQSLLKKVNDIQFKVVDCGGHPCKLSHKGHGKCTCGTTKTCSYCGKSYKEFLDMIEDIFINSDRKQNLTKNDRNVLDAIEKCVNKSTLKREEGGTKDQVLRALKNLK